jgi:HK97 family phage major capsid protein
MAEEAVTELMPIPNSIGARLRSLKQEKGEKLKEARELGTHVALENRNWKPEELALESNLSARIETINTEIARFERLIDVDRRAIVDSPTDNKSGGSSGSFKTIGEFMQAAACACDPSVARDVRGGADLIQKLQMYNAASGMSVGTPSDGGYLVRQDWTTELLGRVRTESQILSRCKSIEIGADFDGLEYPYIDEASRVDGSRWGGVQVFRNAEAAAVTAKQPKIGKGELRLEEMTGLAYATRRLIRDATALSGLLNDAFYSEFAFKIDNEIVRGTGSGQCLGILNSPALVTQAAEGGQTATTVNVDNVLKMYARMPSRLKVGAVWLIHSDVMTQLPKMVIGQMPVWVPPGGLNNLPYGLLLGKPVIEIEQASQLGAVGDILFVNLNEFVVITKAGEGLMADMSMHVRFLNNEITFRFVYRINGQPTARTAITPANGSSTLSAFIALAAR